MRKFSVVAIILAAPVLTHAAERPHQSPADIDSVLRHWGWDGVWSRDCTKPETALARIHNVIPENYGRPKIVLRYQDRDLSTQLVELAHFTSEGRLATTSAIDTEMGTSVTETVWSKQDDHITAWSSRVTNTAKQDIPPSSAAPKGMKAGEQISQRTVEDGFALNAEGKHERPAFSFTKCTD